METAGTDCVRASSRACFTPKTPKVEQRADLIGRIVTKFRRPSCSPLNQGFLVLMFVPMSNRQLLFDSLRQCLKTADRTDCRLPRKAVRTVGSGPRPSLPTPPPSSINSKTTVPTLITWKTSKNILAHVHNVCACTFVYAWERDIHLNTAILAVTRAHTHTHTLLTCNNPHSVLCRETEI